LSTKGKGACCENKKILNLQRKGGQKEEKRGIKRTLKRQWIENRTTKGANSKERGWGGLLEKVNLKKRAKVREGENY